MRGGIEIEAIDPDEAGTMLAKAPIQHQLSTTSSQHSVLKATWHRVCLGIACVMVANCFTVANNYAVTIYNIVPLEILFIRTPLQVLICGGIAWLQGNDFVPITPRGKVFVILVSLSWSLAIFMAVTAVRLLPIGEFVVLVYTSPIVTVIFSSICSRTRPSLIKGLLLFVLLSGTILVVQPPLLFPKQALKASEELTDPAIRNQSMPEPGFHGHLSILEDAETLDHIREVYPHYWLGVGLSLGCSFCVGVGHVLVAQSGDVSSFVLNFYVGIFSGVITLGCSAIQMENRIFTDIGSILSEQWIIMVVFSVLILFSMQLIFLANRLANPTVTSMFRCLEIVITLILDTLLFRDIPGWLSSFGTCLVVVSVLLMPCLDLIQSQVEQNAMHMWSKLRGSTNTSFGCEGKNAAEGKV